MLLFAGYSPIRTQYKYRAIGVVQNPLGHSAHRNSLAILVTVSGHNEQIDVVFSRVASNRQRWVAGPNDDGDPVKIVLYQKRLQTLIEDQLSGFSTSSG